MAYVVYDKDAIWGMGATEDEAREDSRKWLLDAARKAVELGEESADQHREQHVGEALDEIVGRLRAGIATDDLFQAVNNSGGDRAFMVLADGRIGTFDEWAEAADNQLEIFKREAV